MLGIDLELEVPAALDEIEFETDVSRRERVALRALLAVEHHHRRLVAAALEEEHVGSIRAENERIGNLAIIALADPSTWTPTTDPQTKDVVTIDGETGVVQKAHRDPSTSVWVLDCLS